MEIQNNNNNLNYLIDPTFTNVSRLLVLSFERIEENDIKNDYRDSFSHYHVPKVQINDFNALIDEKSFLYLSRKNEEAYEKNIEMSNNNDYMTGNLIICFARKNNLLNCS